MDFDLLVVGSGIAGLTSALTAVSHGLSVIVIEKANVIGGISAHSEAMVWVPCSQQARRAGVEDTPEAARRYVAALAGTAFDPAMVDAYLRNSPNALAMIETYSPVRYALSRQSCDYASDLPGATYGMRALSPEPIDGRILGAAFRRLRSPLATTQVFGGMTIASGDLPHFFRIGRSARSTMIAGRLLGRYAADRLRGYPRGTRIAGGHGVIAGLLRALLDAKVPIWTGARAIKLQQKGDRVVGAEVERSSGPIVLRARCGVILAGGGFPADLERTAATLTHVRAGKRHITLAPATSTGDTVRLALEIGAQLRTDLLHPVAWAPVSLVPSRRGQAVGYPHFIDRQKPGFIAVDGRGQRFVNEADSYHTFVPAMLKATQDDARSEVFLIADHKAIRRYGIGVVPPAPGRMERHIRSGYLVRGDTLADLARTLGIDPQGLAATVTAFNPAAAIGSDPVFHRGESAYNRSNGDPAHEPNPCLAPITVPPFYAVRLYPGDLGTFVGLRTDASARVQSVDGSTISGLYAVGSDMASPMGGSYPGAGVGVGAAVTFGYVAGLHAAESASNVKSPTLRDAPGREPQRKKPFNGADHGASTHRPSAPARLV